MRKAGSIKDKYINAYIDEMAKDGQKIINKAYSSKTTQNRSMNEHDAYVFGVFYNGELVRFGFVGSKIATKKAHGWAKEGIEPFFGREVAEEEINKFKPLSNVGFELVCLVTTFYSGINETKGYRIISQVLDGMEQLSSKYKGAKYRVINSYNGQL